MTDSEKQCIVFTGIPDSSEFRNFQDQVKNKLNANIQKFITNKVSLVVYKQDEKNGSKIKKAKDNGIDCVPLDEFVEAHNLIFHKLEKHSIKNEKKSKKNNTSDYILSSDSDTDNQEIQSLKQDISYFNNEIIYFEKSNEHLKEIIRRNDLHIEEHNKHKNLLCEKLKSI